jgi:hypothetical protein
MAMMPHDSPSMYEALPGLSGNPRCYIEGEPPHSLGDIQSKWTGSLRSLNFLRCRQ